MRLIATLILSFVFLSLALPVLAVPQCVSHDDIAAALARQFGEVVQGQGLTRDGLMMEIWARPATATGPATWTMTMTSPDGITCLLTDGAQFRIAKPGNPV